MQRLFTAAKPISSIRATKRLFSPHSTNVDTNIKKLQKKRIYKNDRLVTKKIAIIKECSITGQTIKRPTSFRLKQMCNEGCTIEECGISRQWDSTTLQQMFRLRLAGDFVFLRPVGNNLEPFDSMPSGQQLLQMYNSGKWVYVTQVCVKKSGQ